jgi:hypothetical protein
MAANTYQVPAFLGIDEGRSENTLEPGWSPEAWNMDTEGGDLAVGKGFAKHISTAVPGAGEIRRMYLWHDAGADKFVVIAGNKAYTWTGSAWLEIYDFTSSIPVGKTLDGANWDFLESRIGNSDYLIIANGVTQMAKWDGTMSANSAEAFGSGEYVFGEDSAVTITALTAAFPKATAVSYSESGSIGTFTLTFDSYTYAADQKIAFTVPQVITSSVKTAKVVAGGNTHTLDYVPEWTGGDVAVIKTTSTTAAEVLAEDWGYTDATLSDAIPEEWADWTKGVGVYIGDLTYEISEIDVARTKVTFKKQTDKVSVGDAVKVRGGISDVAVGYIELYYNRLFAAGDADHPSRLYWSQPPGDVKTIENWSMDDFSESASGGHTEVGPTNNDPIVGLTALSNQLIIHKESGNYRLIGSNPSNFQILQINSGVEKMTNTNRISHGDVPYWLTRAGMYYYNGQQALLHPRSRQMRNTLRSANLDHSKGIECRDKLYFTLRMAQGTGADDTVIYYDMTENVWMKRNGFSVVDIVTRDGEIYLINGNRYVYKVGGTDYDGEDIEAYWRTPITDLGAKSIIKEPRKMIMRGRSGGVNDAISVTEYSGTIPNITEFILPQNDEAVKEIALHNEGRTFHYEFRNKAGSWWKILGGVEILFNGKSME